MTDVFPSLDVDSTLELSRNAGWTERYVDSMLGVFGAPQRILVRGEGCFVWDADGNRYLDLLAGIAVNSLGHANPSLTSAISTQLATLGHVSNFFSTPVAITVAEKLLAVAHAPEGSRVFFTNSGTEANEAAFKISRRTGRTRILALEGAFHGRSMGALALTHKPAYREPFEPLPGEVEHLPFGDFAALEQAMGDDVAAIFVELIQGEAGVRALPPGYLSAARKLASEHGSLLVVDEVQTGIGRTGHWLALHDPVLGEGVIPDVVTLAKGLGGGFPIGAVMTFGDTISQLLAQGQHGTTFGGNPVAAAAALATMQVIERDDILASVRRCGKHCADRAAELHHPLFANARGSGLLRAIEFHEPVAALVHQYALNAGFIVNPVTPNTIRLAPALTVTVAQLNEFFDALPPILDRVAAQGTSEEATF